MISPAQIKLKALKIWESYCVQKSYISKENIFPITISLPKLSSHILQKNFSDLRSQIQELIHHSKDQTGFGYSIIYKEVKHRQLGQQTVPIKITFDALEEFLRFIDKKSEFHHFCICTNLILTAEPTLKSWLINYPTYVLQFKNQWPMLLDICKFMQTKQQPKCYIRELDIPGVDTKLIEQHKKILSELFEQLLPKNTINHAIVQRGAHYFEMRYGFKYDETLIRFRILDKNINYHFHDISIPLSEFKILSLNCDNIFITENKINGLTFPLIEKSIVIFGLGYGIQSLRDIPWMKNKNITYWGDIDTHGFAILSQLRSYYPQTQSFLMDLETLNAFKNLWGEESLEKRCIAILNHLHQNEKILYQQLQDNTWGENVRLEQERISLNYVFKKLKILKKN